MNLKRWQFSILAALLFSVSADALANACVVGKLEEFLQAEDLRPSAGGASGRAAASASDEVRLNREYLRGRGQTPREGDIAYTATADGYNAGRIVEVSPDGKQVVVRDLKTGKERTRDIDELSRSPHPETLRGYPLEELSSRFKEGDFIEFEHVIDGRTQTVRGRFAGVSERGYVKVDQEGPGGRGDRLGIYPESIMPDSIRSVSNSRPSGLQVAQVERSVHEHLTS